MSKVQSGDNKSGQHKRHINADVSTRHPWNCSVKLDHEADGDRAHAFHVWAESRVTRGSPRMIYRIVDNTYAIPTVLFRHMQRYALIRQPCKPLLRC